MCKNYLLRLLLEPEPEKSQGFLSLFVGRQQERQEGREGRRKQGRTDGRKEEKEIERGKMI